MKTFRFGWAIKTLFIIAIVGSGLLTLIGGGVLLYFSHALPNIITVEDYRPRIVSQVIANNGETSTVIGEFKIERRYVIPYEKMPKHLIQAFISAEDDQFFNHQGVNLASIIRASIANFRAGHVVQGGSTITQQVAKSLLLTPEKSFVRKIKELILASQMERNLTKQQILFLYLNQIYLGHSAYGVEAAAKVYFGKDVSELTVAEAALIAGMPQAPGKFSPHLNPKKAKERQAYVLRRMFENKYISESELREALNEKLKVHDEMDVNPKYSPYLVEHLRRHLTERYGSKAVNEEGLTVVVDVDPRILQAAGKAVRAGLREIDKRAGYRGPLKRIKNSQEQEALLEQMRIDLVMNSLGYDVLMPDGHLNTLEAVKLAGMKSEADLLKPDELYKAVVTGSDDKRRVFTAAIGVVKVELPYDELKWTKRVLPTALAKGDVVYIRMLKRDGEKIIATLEQDTEIQAALFSMDVVSGKVLAMEGGYDYVRSEFNRATQAQRQMGSAFKPMVFASALEKGYTPASIIVDAPIVYSDDESGKWKPKNFEEKFYGDTTFRQALIKSRNIPTIKIAQDVEISHVIDFARRIGMTCQFAPDLSMALGSSTTSLAELTRSYAVFPRYGRKVEPIFFSTIKDRDGKVLEETKPKTFPPVDQVLKAAAQNMPAETKAPGSEGEAADKQAGQQKLPNGRVHLTLPVYPLPNDPDQVVDPRVAFVTTHLMKEVVSYGTGHEAKDLGRVAAGKTGTTTDSQDAWFMGFTPEIVTGVWVGYDNLKPIGNNETGARAALPIWLDFMKEAVKNIPESDFIPPPGVSYASIHAQTGALAPPNASYAIKEAFIDGTQPTETVQNNKTGERAAPRSTSDFLKEDIE